MSELAIRHINHKASSYNDDNKTFYLLLGYKDSLLGLLFPYICISSELRKHNSYSSNIHLIHISIHIRFKRMKTDMRMALFNPHPIRFHP
jgi:hypothetical protein